VFLVSWLFLSVDYKVIHVVWHTVPEQFDVPFYLFLVPVIVGGQHGSRLALFGQ
jgi:hypothetical protein